VPSFFFLPHFPGGFGLHPHAGEVFETFWRADGGIARAEGEEAFPKVLSGMLRFIFSQRLKDSSPEEAQRFFPALPCIQNLDALSPPDWNCMGPEDFIFAKEAWATSRPRGGAPLLYLLHLSLIEGKTVRLRSSRRSG